MGAMKEMFQAIPAATSETRTLEYIGGGALAFMVLKEGFAFMGRLAGKQAGTDNAVIHALGDTLQKMSESNNQRWGQMVERMSAAQTEQAKAITMLTSAITKLDSKMDTFISNCPAGKGE